MAACMTDTFQLGATTVVFPIVNMFHANAWSIPYAAAVAGAKLVLGGPHTDVATLQRLIIAEKVDLALAVPTIWLGMLQHLEKHGGGLGVLDRTAIGGSAVPRSMIEGFDAQQFHHADWYTALSRAVSLVNVDATLQTQDVLVFQFAVNQLPLVTSDRGDGAAGDVAVLDAARFGDFVGERA